MTVIRSASFHWIRICASGLRAAISSFVFASDVSVTSLSAFFKASSTFFCSGA